MNNSISRTEHLPSIKNKDVTVLTPHDVESLETTPNVIKTVTPKQLDSLLADLGINIDFDNVKVMSAEEVIAAQPKQEANQNQNISNSPKRKMK